MTDLKTQSSDQFTSNIEMPLTVRDVDEVNWQHEADIIVVGLGGAGVVAALQALSDGASVLAVDRFGGGGATEKSGGVVYAGGTTHLLEAGYQDTAEEMYKYLSYEGTPVREETLRRFCETSAENIEWLESFGVQFGSSVYEERIAYPPDGYFLYYTGMEKFRESAAKAAPRGHRTLGKGPTGRYYFPPLRQAALANGLKFVPHAPVRRLIMDEKGIIVGVEIQEIPEEFQKQHEKIYRKVDPYKPLNGATAERAIAECREFEASVPINRISLKANKGVLLSAGGYNYNLELFGRYRPIVKKTYKALLRGGSMGCDGSGIELGVSAGGDLSHMDRLFCTKAISPPNAFIYGILINKQARRFIAEDAYVGNVGCAITEQSDMGWAWLILDSSTFWKGIRQATWPLKNMVSWWGMPALLNLLLGGTKRANSIDELAKKLDIDARSLEQTVNQYNECVAQGHDSQCEKLRQHMQTFGNPPYFAVNLCVANKWGFSGTMPYGGLTVDEDTGNVTRSDGTPIPGLYAAGRTAVGICSESNFSGLSIADTVFSGRRAARAAMQRNDLSGSYSRLAS